MCLCCELTESDGIKLTKDHVVPLSKGGDNWITNLQPLCERCNNEKADEIIDYRAEGIRQRITSLSKYVMRHGVLPEYA
jgi:5-methylcytosine-specific restriction endonuclease McrA